MTARSLDLDVDFVRDYLRRHGSDVFFVEHNAMTFSNHLAQGCIGLQLLGEHDKDRFLRRANDWASRMEPPDGTASMGINGVSDVEGESFESLRGKRRGFYAIRKHFQKMLRDEYDSDIWKMLAEEFPKLQRGLWTKFFHPMLLLGYGCNIELPGLVLDGLSYFHHTYTGPRFENNEIDPETFGNGDLELIQIVEILRTEKIGDELSKMAVEYLKDTKEGHRLVGFIEALFDNGKPLMELVDRVKMPSFNGDSRALFRWLMIQTLTIYQGSELKNNFFLLHGVTSSWALGQIVDKINDRVSWTFILQCVRDHLFGLLGTYLVEGRPKILTDHLKNIDGLPTMEEIRKKFLEDEEKVPDEHSVKLIKVSYCLWKDGKRAEYVEDKEELEVLFRRAALTAIENPSISIQWLDDEVVQNVARIKQYSIKPTWFD